LSQKVEYRWPAEWEPQSATWVSWPHRLATWPNRFQPIPDLYVRWIHELTAIQPVYLISGPASAQPSASSLLAGLDNLTILNWPTNDVWIRDYGPTFVQRISDGRLVGVDWQFNAWGGKYPPFDDDAAVTERICNYLDCPRNRSLMVCEGGGLETDGQGTLLTTSSVLLNAKRNPGWSRPQIEAELSDKLGVQKIIWVDGGGLVGDDTDGHVDQLARFVAPGIVVAATSSSSQDPNAEGLERNLKILQESTDAEGRPLTVHRLPTPPPRTVQNQRVPESYCNFLFLNGAVLLPTFGSPDTDKFAIALMEQLLPEHRIVPLDASDLIYGLGAFHCASQQQPRST
jgi:agmatine deiminase